VIETAAQRIWDFLVRPDLVQKITPSEMEMKYVKVPEVLSPGAQLEFNLIGFGPPLRVVHEVSRFEPTTRFTETQVKGPLKSWDHEHIIADEGNGRASLTDRITFEPPGGMVGYLVTADKILAALTSGFQFRHQELKRLLEAGGVSS
jgi:ligand-binding SRPBCC domain-containing protein